MSLTTHSCICFPGFEKFLKNTRTSPSSRDASIRLLYEWPIKKTSNSVFQTAYYFLRAVDLWYICSRSGRRRCTHETYGNYRWRRWLHFCSSRLLQFLTGCRWLRRPGNVKRGYQRKTTAGRNFSFAVVTGLGNHSCIIFIVIWWFYVRRGSENSCTLTGWLVRRGHCRRMLSSQGQMIRLGTGETVQRIHGICSIWLRHHFIVGNVFLNNTFFCGHSYCCIITRNAAPSD